MQRIVLHQTGRDETDVSKYKFINDGPIPMRGHPLTCGNDSTHQLLFPIVDGGKIKLVCADCNYTQEHIPF